jgi:periplasmic copper chaperone A
MKRITIAAALVVLVSGAAFAQGKVSDIHVDHVWAPAMTGGKLTNSAAYMRLTDRGTEPDELISASSPVAGKVELHVFGVESGVYGMHRVDSIRVSPGAAATVLQPGGAHVMLEGLKRPLKAGETFPLSLTFKKAGEVNVEATVEDQQVAKVKSY